MKRLLIILFLFTSCAKSQVGTLRINKFAHAKPQLPSRIIYFGDSFTQYSANTYPAHIAADYPSIHFNDYAVGCTAVYNSSCGVGYNGVSNLIDRYQPVLDSMANAGGYDGRALFSFAFGQNDISPDQTWKTTYQGIIQAFIDAGVPRRRIILIAEPNHSTQAAAHAPARAYILQIATELRVQFYDCYQRFLDTGLNDTYYTSGDGYVHPNNDGQLVWTAGFETFLIR